MAEEIPIKEVSLNEAKPEVERVSVIGWVEQLNPKTGECVLREKNFSLKARFPEKNRLNEAKKGDFLRVIGKPFYEGKEIFLLAEFMQVLKGFDEKLLERVKKMEKGI